MPLKKFNSLSILRRTFRIFFLPVMALFTLGYVNIGFANIESTSIELTNKSNAQISPSAKTDDYITISCEDIWLPDNPVMLENQTYWLRAIDCSARLSAASTRSIAKNFPDTNWVNSLKKVILLDASNPSLTERKRMIELLNRYRAEFPTTLRPLLQIMRRQQELELSFEEEIARYQRLEQFSNTEIAALREERDRINLQLEETQLKLENIADIERKMSLRRQQQQQIDTVLDHTTSSLQDEQNSSSLNTAANTENLSDSNNQLDVNSNATVINDSGQNLQPLNPENDPLYFQLITNKKANAEFILKLSALNKYQMMQQAYSPRAEQIMQEAESRWLPFEGMGFFSIY